MLTIMIIILYMTLYLILLANNFCIKFFFCHFARFNNKNFVNYGIYLMFLQEHGSRESLSDEDVQWCCVVGVKHTLGWGAWSTIHTNGRCLPNHIHGTRTEEREIFSLCNQIYFFHNCALSYIKRYLKRGFWGLKLTFQPLPPQLQQQLRWRQVLLR